MTTTIRSIQGLAALLRSLLRRSWGGGGCCCLVASVMVAGLTGQERGDFVFHVYVDPVFGDNEEAFALNPGNRAQYLAGGFVDPGLASHPGWPGRLRPLPLDRRSDIDPGDDPQTTNNYAITGVLQQAPFSFRTLSGEFGAVEYVNRVFSIADPSGSPVPAVELPWTHPTGQPTRRVTHVVIHCLPGLYGPRISDDPAYVDIDPVSGLPWNGETFPIVLGGREFGLSNTGLFDRISIQGTSALDTIFDARGSDLSLPPWKRRRDIIQVRGGAGNHQHEEDFIDGITLRNTKVPEPGYGWWGDSRGAAIHFLGSFGRFRTRVTNCLMVDNVAGIVIDAHGLRDGALDRWGQHEPLVANNTFYNNRIGIWSGQLTTANPPASQSFGPNLHAPLIINNAFWADDQSSSAFEGLNDQVLQLGVVNGAVLSTNMDFNAWVPTQANPGFDVAQLGWSGSWVSTGFTGGIATPPPRVDLTGHSHLFVCQLLGPAFEGHDLRLAPSSTFAGQPRANPLLGMGVSLATPSATLPGLRSVIGTAWSGPPGLPASVEEAPIHGWDFDCEGFGNPRLEQRIGSSPTAFGTSDIGADQCGQLIMAGYVPSTRMFVANENGSNEVVPANIYNQIFFVDNASVSGRPRPDSVIIIGTRQWSENARRAPQALMTYGSYAPVANTSFYTEGLQETVYQPAPNPPTQLYSNRAILYLLGLFGPFPRNLACDFSPHLLVDPHPWTDAYSLTQPQLAFPLQLADPYCCNPEYAAPTRQYFNPPLVFDNPALYHNRNGVPHGPGGWSGAFQQFSFVTSAHLNPPGTLLTSGSHRFIASSPPPGQFGPLSCGSSTIATDASGIGLCPDVVPNLLLDLGVRVNCEVPGTLQSGANTNLQTFLVIARDILTLPQQGLSSYGLMSAGSPASSLDGRWRVPAGLRSGDFAARFGVPAGLGVEARTTLQPLLPGDRDASRSGAGR